MKFKGTIIGEASGSLASMTFSHNRGGQYIRTRAIPTNPNTPQQQAIRSLVGQLTSLWNNTLTVAQRLDWQTYADQVPLLDALGEPRAATGLNHYVRSNVPRLQAAEPRVDDAPTVFNLGDFTPTTMTNATEATQTFDIGYTAADDWANEDDAALLVYGSRPQNPSINFFKGPYRYAGKVQGDSVTPPTSPETVTSPFAFAAGQRLFARIQVSRADGRLSLSQRLFQTAAA